MKKFLVVTACFLISGCGTTKEWYKTYKYEAPKGWKREKALEKELEKKRMLAMKKSAKNKEKSLYEKEVQELMVKLLRTPPTPLRVPDRILRVLILPYVDENGNLIAGHYTFLKVEEGKWIMGDYLIEKEKPIREFTPLDE